MTDKINICWFRQDLRLCDNPALAEAARTGKVLPIYILDDEHGGTWRPGGAARLWLHHSLKSLSDSLNQKLQVFSGRAEDILAQLCETHRVKGVYWNRCYEPWQIERDTLIKQQLSERRITAASFNGSLLWEPWEILKKDRTPYKIFTPYYTRAVEREAHAPVVSFPEPENLHLADMDCGGTTIDDLGLRPDQDWCEGIESQWRVGEPGGRQVLDEFISDTLHRYKAKRDFPGIAATSRLSPYLHCGEISPHAVWQRLTEAGTDENSAAFKRQLVWREFSYSLLYHNPQLPEKNLKPKFDRFPWMDSQHRLTCWQRGRTGYPFVDAGMRELYQTGFMHNRVRLVVGSFLVKNLLIHWRHGADWFWDTLLEADLANNSANWQWVAGCGTDAAPYFRIFNPVSQGMKYDSDGSYTRRFVPELKDLPNKYLFCPWEAPSEILKNAGVELGASYPRPIVDLKLSRQKALEAFRSLG